MALRNQPYFPLYVQDYLTDEKLNSCNAASQGVYIKVLCILHKQDEYGCILLKQKDKQKDKQILNFAWKLASLITFDYDTIKNALVELIDEGVLIIEEDKLYQKRMVKDGNISLIRSKVGKAGGGNPNLLKQNPKQKGKQKPEYENEYENVNKIKVEECEQYFEDAGYDRKLGRVFWGYYNAQSWTTGGEHPRKIDDWTSKAFEIINSPDKLKWLMGLEKNNGNNKKRGADGEFLQQLVRDHARGQGRS